MLSEDDAELASLGDAELDQAWDLWFDLAQATNDDDPPYAHGVFQLARLTPDPHPGSPPQPPSVP